jgi:hypothetical protein
MILFSVSPGGRGDRHFFFVGGNLAVKYSEYILRNDDPVSGDEVIPSFFSLSTTSQFEWQRDLL